MNTTEKEKRTNFEVVPVLLPHLGFIRAIPFEHAGSTTYKGDAVKKYVPENGWVETTGNVDDGSDWYISNSGGVVYVSKESGNIVRVDVSFTSKRTYIRTGKWVEEDGDQGHITLTVREEPDDEELRPEWATESTFDEE